MELIRFWFLDHLSTCLSFQLSYKSHGFGVDPIIRQFTGCFNTFFLSLGGTQVHYFRVAYNHFQGFMNFVESKLLNITKSSINKLFKRLIKKRFWKQFFQTHTFFEKIHGMCKYHQIIIFHIFFRNVYNLFEQCKIFFVYLHISPSPCCPFIYFVNYPFHSRFPMF